MSLNEPKESKRTSMSSNESQWAQIVIQLLPVMHIKYKAWHMLRFLKQNSKCRK